jgi:phosphatidyl-myo-inositol dimannoside synthase
MRAWMLITWLGALRIPRLVLTFHGSEILRFHAHPILRALTRKLIRNAWRISTLTHYTSRLLCEHFPEAQPKICHSPGALRTDLSIKPHARPSSPRPKLIILTVGRIHPRKGQLLTLQALEALPPEISASIEYWIAGSTAKPAYARQLREAASTSCLTVRFLGTLNEEDLDKVYAQADIFALTSIDHEHSVEGFGLVYLEAAAHGLPVIAHRVGGVSEAVLHDETGLLVSPSNPADLSVAFAKLIGDPALRDHMGRAGRVWARRNTWTRSAELLFNHAAPLPQHPSS